MLIGSASSTTSSTTTGAASTALAVVPSGTSGDLGVAEAARNAAAAAALGLTGGHPQGPQLSLSLFEREGQWQAALAGHDLGLRRSMGLGGPVGWEGQNQLAGGGIGLGAAGAGNLAAGYGECGGDAGAGGGAAAAAAAAVGMVSALRHMGGNVAARVFLSGLASQQWQPGASTLGPGAGGGEPGGLGAPGQLRELQYELSWRLGAWGMGMSPSAGTVGQGAGRSVSGGSGCDGSGGGAGASPGFGGGSDVGSGSGTGLHECVLRCLGALSSGDTYQVGYD